MGAPSGVGPFWGCQGESGCRGCQGCVGQTGTLNTQELEGV